MTLDFDPAEELAAIHGILDTFDRLRNSGPEVMDRRAPQVSGWSVAQHLYHCALATGLSLRNTASLVRGKGRLIQEEGSLSKEAEAVLASGRTERGQAEAPRMVTPPEEVNPEFLAMELETNRKDMERLAEQASEILAAPNWIPHQLLGPLDAVSWLRFTHLHAKHHLDIAQDILAEAPA